MPFSALRLRAGVLSLLSLLLVLASSPLPTQPTFAQTPTQSELDSFRKIADSTYLVGTVAVESGEYQKALGYHQQSLEFRRILKDKTAINQSLVALAGVYDKLGQYQKSLEYYQQALKDSRGSSQEGIILNGIGTLYSHLKQYQKALDTFQRALVIHRNYKSAAYEAQALNNIGLAYDNLGQQQKALEFYQQALALTQKTGDRIGQSVLLNNMAALYQAQKQPQRALKIYQQVLAEYKELGNLDWEGTALNNIGSVYDDLNQPSAALEYYQQALAIYQKSGDKVGGIVAQTNLAETQDRQGDYATAEKNLFAALKASESLRPGLLDADKIALFEGYLSSYRLLQEVLVAQNKTTQALEIAERGRARAFIELLATRLRSSEPVDSAQTIIEPPTIRQIQQIAQLQDATLVEYSLIKRDQQDSKLFIWVIRPRGDITFRQVNLKTLVNRQKISLEDLVFQSRESIGAKSRGLVFKENRAFSAQNNPTPVSTTVNPRLQQLHSLLIQPIADLLPQNPQEQVIFVPQGPLFFVPFAALQDQSGRYLIQQHTVRVTPAIQMLKLTDYQRRQVISRQAGSIQGDNVLVVGNPTMPKIALEVGQSAEQLPSLPGAEREARTIAPLFKTRAITGNQATKAAILQKMPQARLIHLATHGLLDDLQGLGVPGAIALAPSKQDDGFLTANEILAMRLNAELVVLSACNTGRGRVTGDGVIGLSRSLISAGVPSVIVSLWQVPDAPTSALMTAFYRNFQRNSNKATSLRQAMLDTMQEYPDPLSWAGFTLIGEAQ